MSLAAYSSSGGGISSIPLTRASSSSQSIPQPILRQRHNNSNIIDSSVHAVQRGDLTGDDCYTVNLCNNKASIWLERSQKVEYLKSKVPAAVVDMNGSFDNEKADSLSSVMTSFKDDAAAIVERETEIWAKKEEEMGFTKKKKKSKSKRSGLTLVLPCTVCMNQSKLSGVLLGVRQSGLTLKNIFNEGIAAVAGLLFTKADGNELDEIRRLNSPLIMYICEKDGYFEGATISCEGGEDARRLGNNMGYDRLCTIAMCEKTSNVTAVTRCLLDAAEQLEREIAAVAISGDLTESDLSLPQYKHFKVDANATTAGGCILSAAELDSSKQYMNLEEGQVLAYQFSIADSCCSEEIGMSIENSKGEAAVVEQIYSSGDRIWKNDHGPIRPGMISNVRSCTHTRTLKWGSVYFRSKNDYKTGWPVMRLHHRKKGCGDWIPFREIRPLLDEGTGQPVESCSTTVQMNAHSGEVVCTLTKGNKVSDIKGRHTIYLQIMGLLLLLAALVAAFFLLRMYYKYSVRQKHVAWLVRFYSKNAPDKLKDMVSIERTIDKYNDKMFVLWRTLERTYNIKWPAPEDILDDL